VLVETCKWRCWQGAGADVGGVGGVCGLVLVLIITARDCAYFDGYYYN